MTIFSEHALELSIMELFRQEGYTYTNGEEIHKGSEQHLVSVRYILVTS